MLRSIFNQVVLNALPIHILGIIFLKKPLEPLKNKSHEGLREPRRGAEENPRQNEKEIASRFNEFAHSSPSKMGYGVTVMAERFTSVLNTKSGRGED